MNLYRKNPSLALLGCIGSLLMISDASYSQLITNIGRDLDIQPKFMEQTFVTYLIGFACGTLFWGKISDKIGRKKSTIFTLSVYALGCLLCYLSYNFSLLMLGRFIQGIGASGGIVLSQAITRDVWSNPNNNIIAKKFAIIASITAGIVVLVAFSTSIVLQIYTWRNIFILLIIFALILLIIVMMILPETIDKNNNQNVSIKIVLRGMINDRILLVNFVIAGLCQGMNASYYCEAPFFLKSLGILPYQYGYILTFTACFSVLSNQIVRIMHNRKISLHKIINGGIYIVLTISIFFTAMTLLYHFYSFSEKIMVFNVICMRIGILLGSIAMVFNSTVAIALISYRWCTGTASSILGFIYAMIASLVALGISFLHNNSLFTMPIYFLLLSLSLLIIRYRTQNWCNPI